MIERSITWGDLNRISGFDRFRCISFFPDSVFLTLLWFFFQYKYLNYIFEMRPLNPYFVFL